MAFVVRPDGSISADTLAEALAVRAALLGVNAAPTSVNATPVSVNAPAAAPAPEPTRAPPAPPAPPATQVAAPLTFRRPRGAGHIQQLPRGWRWKANREGTAHCGPSVATREEAEQGLEAFRATAPPTERPGPRWQHRAGRDGVAEELQGLLPWSWAVDVEYRPVLEARAAGKLPYMIAQEIGEKPKWVANALLRARAKMIKARDGGAPQRADPQPAADDEDPDGAHVGTDSPATAGVTGSDGDDATTGETDPAPGPGDLLDDQGGAPDVHCSAAGAAPVALNNRRRGAAAVADLVALAPWAHLLGPRNRQIYQARVAGELPAEIAARLGLKAQSVHTALFQLRRRLEIMRRRGLPAQAPALAAENQTLVHGRGEVTSPPVLQAAHESFPKVAAAPPMCGPGVRAQRDIVGESPGAPPAAEESTEPDESPAYFSGAADIEDPGSTTATERQAFSSMPPLDAPQLNLTSIPPRRNAPRWDRADPEEDLTDLAVDEPPAAPPEVVHPEPRAAPAPVSQVDDASAPTEALARARRKLRVLNGGRVRAKTVALPAGRDQLPRAEFDLSPDTGDHALPATRAECENGFRPCPLVRCKYNLYLDVSEATGTIKLNFPHLEPWEMRESCVLDVADRGGITLEDLGAVLNLTRERIRQIEVRALDRIKDHTAVELGLPPERAA